MKLKFLFISLFIFALGYAQESGTIKGTVTDLDMNNEPLPFASVALKGTNIGTNTDMNGEYSFKVPAGNHTLVFGFLGYETIEVAVTVATGETKVVNKGMASTSVQLQDVVIEKSINREKESALLLQQKNAVEIKQSIGAQEMSRKGVSNAEGALTKVTGISKQQGEKNVFVRGLGDRYNFTTMNGLPLPSEDPIYKNISLDYFSSDIIKNISVNKTFSAELFSDVAGANIDIVSKEFVGDDYIEVKAGTGINTQTYNEDFYTIDGGTFAGFSDKDHNISDLNNYSFNNSLDPNSQSTPINSSLSVSGGKRFKITDDSSLSMFLVGSFDNSYLYREENAKQTTSIGQLAQDYDVDRYTYNVSQTAMGNFKYRFGGYNSISFNTLYIHDNSQELANYFGFNNPEVDGDLEYTRRQYVKNSNIFVNQILSKFELTSKWELNVDLGYNLVNGSEPDRRTNSIIYRNGTFRPNSNSAGNHERYFSTLKENDFSGKAIASYKFNTETNTKLDFGYVGRITNRDFDATIFNHRFFNTSQEIDINNFDGLFNQTSLDAGVFELQTGRGRASNPDAFLPFYYKGKRNIHAGLVMFTHSFSDEFTLSAGGRYEKVNQEIDYNTNLATNETFGDADIDKSYFMPDFNIKYSFSDDLIIRAAGSITYTLPQFIEAAPFKNQGVTSSYQGNPNLVPSTNYNADLKFEFYPNSEEIIAVTGFYKLIDDPINRSEIPSAGNTLTFFNTGSTATVAGAELELKKNIYKIENSENLKEDVISGGLNISYLHSVQKLEATLPQFTNEGGEEQLQGAAPWLVNADLTYRRSTENFNLTSSVVFNYFSDRVYSIGTRGFENVIEKGVPTLDFVAQTELGKHFGISFKARNLFNPDIKLERKSNGDVFPKTTLSSYKTGIDLSLGLSYKF